jgi:hypothetical protein
MSDSQAEMGVAKPKGMGRIERDHRVAMEKWLGAERVYTGGKSGAKMNNLRWCMGGGAKGPGTGMKEAKDVKSSGAFLALARHINSKFNLKDDKKWTGNMAKSRFDNMMKTFRKVLKEIQFPREETFGTDKNAYAGAVQKCGEQRAKKCASYGTLWPLLRDHPKFCPKNKRESFAPTDDDFESDTSHSKSESEGSVKYEFDDGDDGKDEGNEAKALSDSEEDNDEENADASSETSADGAARTAYARASPRGSPVTPRPAMKQARSSTSPKAGKTRAGKRGVKRKKFTLKKPHDTMSHADITRSYLHTRDMQTSAFFAISLLRERRATFFGCLSQGITDAAEIEKVFTTIGLGKVPDFFHEYMIDVGQNGEAAEAAEDEQHQ